MSLVDNARNPRGFTTLPKEAIQLKALTATTPTLTIDTNIYDLGQVLKNGALAVVTTDFTFAGGVFAPAGASLDDVYTIERVTKVEEVNTRPEGG